MEKPYVVITYSFDTDVPMFVFTNETEARNYIRKDFFQELQLQKENETHTLHASINDKGTFAQIGIVHEDGSEDDIEWNLVYERELPEDADTKYNLYTLYLYDKDGDVYTTVQSDTDLDKLIAAGKELSDKIENGELIREDTKEPYDWAEIRDQFENRYWMSTIG